MPWVIAGGMLGGIALLALGAVALRTGWTPPWTRRHVSRPALYGLGALLLGTPCLAQGVFYFRLLPVPSWEIRFFGCNGLLLAGLTLLAVSQMLPAHQPGSQRKDRSEAPSS
jgi:hypothetical protein